MQEIDISLTGITLQKFDPKQNRGTFLVEYVIDQAAGKETLTIDLLKQAEAIVQNILRLVKSRAQANIDSPDDLIGNLFVKRLVDEERIEEKMLNFFHNICEQHKKLTNERNHQQYMLIYHHINGSNVRF